MRRLIKTTTRKLNCTMKKNKTITIIFGVLVIILIALVLIKFTTKEPMDKTPSLLQTKYEITEDDIFSQKDLVSIEVSVLGTTLGQKAVDVLSILGTPDSRAEFPPNIQNYEYGKAIGLEYNGLILHFEDGILTRITMNEFFREKLIGKTKEIVDKKGVYGKFGAPDDTQFVPMSQNSARVFRLLSYYEQGLEFHIQTNELKSFSLVP